MPRAIRTRCRRPGRWCGRTAERSEHLPARRRHAAVLHHRPVAAGGGSGAHPPVGAVQGGQLRLQPLAPAPIDTTKTSRSDGHFAAVAGLTVRYGTTPALDGLDLTVGRNELFVLLGGSGSGKTTLLRAIGGFVRPDAGRIVLDDADLSGLPPHRRPVNTMFQSYALFPHLSVAANIGFGLRQRGVSRAEIRRRVRGDAGAGAAGRFRRAPAARIVGRPAAARRAGPQPGAKPACCCCWMSRCRRWIRRCDGIRAPNWCGCGAHWASVSFWSRTTRRRRWRWPTGSASCATAAWLRSARPRNFMNRRPDRFVAEFLGAANILPCVVDGCSVALAGVGRHRAGRSTGCRGAGAAGAAGGTIAHRRRTIWSIRSMAW